MNKIIGKPLLFLFIRSGKRIVHSAYFHACIFPRQDSVWKKNKNKGIELLSRSEISEIFEIFKKKNLPTHVFVSAYRAEGLEQHSIALCEQVTALDYGRIIENMGRVDGETLARITEAVQVQIGVFDKYN